MHQPDQRTTRSRPGAADAWAGLGDATDRLSTAEALDQIVQIVLDTAARLSAADSVCFVLRDGELCHYVDEQARAPLWKGRRFPVTECVSGWAMLNRQTVVIPEVLQDPRVSQEKYAPTFVRSLAVIPVGDDPVAAIGVYWAERHVPDPETVALLEALARSAAAALDGATRHRALVKRVTELAALYRLTDRLYRSQSLEDACEAALDAVLSALGCPRASILLLDDDGAMRFVASRGLSESYRRAVEGYSPWQPGDLSPQPIFIEDILASDGPEALRQAVVGAGIRSLAFFPLVARAGVVGSFMTCHDSPHVFSAHEVELAAAITHRLGYSIGRRRAEDARRAAEDSLRRNEERLRLATRTGKVGLWDWDIVAESVSWTDSLYTIHGVDRASFRPSVENFVSLLHPDDRQYVSETLRRTLEEDAPYELEFRAVRPDGKVIWIFTNALALREDGRPVRLVGASVDITDRRQAEERFRLAVEAAPSGMVLADAEGRIALVNAQAEKLFCYERCELVGKPVELLVPERFRGTHPAFRERYGKHRSARPMGAGRDLFALRKDGSEVPVEIGLSPIETNDGPMVLGAIVDISERKRAEAQRDLLLAELNHRVKNTLAVVQGIAQQTFRGQAATPEAREAFEGRLTALGEAHNLLTRSNWETAALERLAEDALRSSAADQGRVTIAGPRVLLQPKPALAIAMALHELCTNALKYGALSNETGSVALEWSHTDGPLPRLKLCWTERDGPPVAPPTRRGFGSRMIEQALAHDLDGQVSLDFRPEGLVCTIDAPLPICEAAP